MSEVRADISGSTGANFSFTIDAATILSAYLEVPNKPVVALEISDDDREVTVPNLPAGNSFVRLDLAWAPGDPHATIDVGTVTSGTVKVANPKHTIDDGETPGYVLLFGK
jgi:hypothetical protein